MIFFCKKVIRPLVNLCKTHRIPLIILLFTWGSYFFILFTRTLEFEPEGLYTNHANVYGDWPLHIGMANIFAYKEPQDWFAYHPIYADGKFTYGFLTNLISGILMRLGFPLYFSFVVPSIIYIVLLLLGFYVLFNLILKSKKQSLVAISIFFLSSGLGFFRFIRDLLNGEPIRALFFPDPALDYTQQAQYGWPTSNLVVGIFLPQRAFLLGMTMAIWALIGVVYVIQNQELSFKKRTLILLGSSLLAGLLPIVHTHSLIVLFIVTGLLCLSSYKNWIELFLFYAVPTSFLGITLYLVFISGGIEDPDFMQWRPGWNADGGFIAWVIMWLKLWGLMLPVAAAGVLLIRKRSLQIKAFFLSFFLLFLVGNLVQFQPNPWDNTKLFAWSYLSFSGLATIVLAWIWKYGGRYLGRIDAILLTILLTFTGFLELTRLQRLEETYHPFISSQDDINLAVKIREKTDPLARFLIAPLHTHLVTMWAARPVLLGYPGWASSHGFLIAQTEQDIRTMFLGNEDAETLLTEHQISYVAIGPDELNYWQANEDYYAKHYPVVFRNKNYRIYDVRSRR